MKKWYNIEAGSLPDFVWGELWTYTFTIPEGATYCFGDSGALADGVTQADYGSATFSGYVTPGSTPGLTEFTLQFYDESLVPVGSPVAYSARTKFRIRFAEVDTIPASIDIDSAYIDSITWSSKLVETAREVSVSYPTIGKYRLMLLHYPVIGGGRASGLAAGFTINRIRLSDNSDWTTLSGVNAPTYVEVLNGYAGYPFNDNDLVLGSLGVGAVWTQWLFVSAPDTNPLTVYLHSFKDDYQGFNPNYNDTPFTYNNTVNQYDPSLYTLLDLEVETGMAWATSFPLYNKTAVGVVCNSRTISVQNVFTFDGSTVLATKTNSRTTGPQALTAYGGSMSGSGSWFWDDGGADYTSPITTTSQPSLVSALVGTGTKAVSIVGSHTISVLFDGTERYGTPDVTVVLNTGPYPWFVQPGSNTNSWLRFHVTCYEF